MITVITSNQPRHIYLINELAKITDVVAVVQLFDKPVHTNIESPVMTEYFERMRLVEKVMFPETDIKATKVFEVPTTVGAIIDDFDYKIRNEVNASDHVIVFGSSWIKNEAYELIKDKAINLHAGIGYRGASCNAHAIAEGRKHLVGFTVQRLSEGLDCGEPLFYAYADEQIKEPFALGMSAVINVVDELVEYLMFRDKDTEAFNSDWWKDKPTDTFTSYKRKSDFTDEIAQKIMKL